MTRLRRAAENPTASAASWPQRLGAEAFGTFALVFAAAGGDTFARLANGEISTEARAVAPALMVAALIYAVGDVSGAHFNPVVTLAFAAKGLFPARSILPYWAAQGVGALGAALLLRILFGDALNAGVSTPHVSAGTAVVIEVVLALMLVTVILGTADRARVVGPDAALAVGATLALCGLIALPVEGASMNPARSLGPAFVTGDLANAWIYVIGPFVGGLLAVLLTRLLHGPTEDDPQAAEAAQGE
ncbi:MAG: MIP/aquaporin family protein [Candidatus Limnocylindrales bacterium]